MSEPGVCYNGCEEGVWLCENDDGDDDDDVKGGVAGGRSF